MRHEERRLTVDRWVGEYAERVHAVARSFAADEDSADDLSQEIWVKVYRKAHLRPDGAPPGPWIHTLAVRHCLDRMKRAKRREGLLFQWVGIKERSADAEPRFDPLGQARLLTAIHRLPQRQRDVVLLRYLEDRSTAETAEQLGIAHGSVKASLYKALQKLRADLDSPDMRSLVDES